MPICETEIIRESCILKNQNNVLVDVLYVLFHYRYRGYEEQIGFSLHCGLFT